MLTDKHEREVLFSSDDLYHEKNDPPEVEEYISETHAVHNIPGFRPSKPIATRVI